MIFPPPLNKQLLKQVCDQWKDFKSTLTKDYIGGNKKGESPCSQYPFVDEDTRKQFVKSQENPKLQKSTVANKAKQSKNVYKHYLSRGGYKMEEKNIEPDSKDSLKKQSTQGSFTPSRETTILATAIGKSDYPKHVREVGKGVDLVEYFVESSSNSSSMVSKEELHELLKEEREETMAEGYVEVKPMLRIQNDMLAEVKSMMISIMSKGQVPETPSQGSPMVQSENSSNNLLAKSPSVDIDPNLYLEVPNQRFVTNSRMYTLGLTTHHQQIQNGQGDVAIPFPTDEAVVVSHAKENFVHGQKKHVEMVSKMTPKKESIVQLPPINLEAAMNFHYLTRLRDVVTSMEEAYSFKMPSKTVGSDLTYNFVINKKNLIEFLTMKELDAVYMQLAIL
ncbi:hypothetical protein K1719_045299 [Acacia pycnantha]|nr:hypothetical protein K1719_045299 [Acacia pycnantha]